MLYVWRIGLICFYVSGYGCELVMAGIEFAKMRSCVQVYANVHPSALEFYAKMGFVEGKTMTKRSYCFKTSYFIPQQ